MLRPIHEMESKWQKRWEEERVYLSDSRFSIPDSKFFGLIEFPYPSGDGLHVGHPRSYTAIDLVTRKRRMEGRNVLYPIGWDAFGLPTENYAIKNKLKPADATKKNVANFTRQIKSLGCGFDWSREINTTDPAYYKWTQWQFLQFFKHGMAYKAASTINWCPRCKIGLANEEAQGGVCERCGNPIEKREKEQWMIRITDYAERLISDLETVDYLENIKTQQIHWIGKSESIKRIMLATSNESKVARIKKIMSAVLPQVEIVTPKELGLKEEEVEEGDDLFVNAARKASVYADKTELPILGMDTGFFIEGEQLNPSSPKRNALEGKKESTMTQTEKAEAMDVFYRGIAERHGGEVEAHWKDALVLHLPSGEEIQGEAIRPVILTKERRGEMDIYFPVRGLYKIKANGKYVVDQTEEEELTVELAPLKNALVNLCKTSYRLRDWVFSRQRYWGEPIPLVHCSSCAKKKQKALIIHGLGTSAEKEWYPELKNALKKEGYEVFTPSLPDPLAPTYEGWMQVLRPILDQFGEDDVIVGHSLGGTVAVHAVSEMRQTIGYVYLVAPLLGPISDEMWAKKQIERPDRDYASVRKIWERPIDWVRVSSSIGSANVLVSDNDLRIPKQTHAHLPAHWYIKSLGKQDHFGGVNHPEIIREVLTSKLTGWIPVPDAQLPLTLPDVEAYEPTDTGDSPLAKMEDWVKITCPRCDGPARRETDTMPNWAGSSWYFLRYCDPHNANMLASPEALKYWIPVDLYNGGMEHTTLHLLYSRFWYKFLYDLGVIPEVCGSEPYRVRRSHNMILGEGGVKMSKSKGNVVNPDDVIEKYGADVFRVYEMFIGPYDQPAPWDTNGIEGIRRFLDKVWGLFSIEKRESRIENTEYLSSPTQPIPDTRYPIPDSLLILYHQTVKKVSEGIDHLQFNTAVSQLMIFTNALLDSRFSILNSPDMAEGYLKLLAPFAPHLVEEIWREKLGHTTSIHAQGAGWPVFDPTRIHSATFELVIQVNGKVRDKMTVASDLSEDEAKTIALASEKIQRWLAGNPPQQITYIPGRLVTIVV